MNFGRLKRHAHTFLFVKKTEKTRPHIYVLLCVGLAYKTPIIYFVVASCNVAKCKNALYIFLGTDTQGFWLKVELMMLVALIPTVSLSHGLIRKLGRVIVVLAALLYFSSLHLCRISKLLWCTGCCRKLKLSIFFNTAQGAASSCPWRSKTKRKERRENMKGRGGRKGERNKEIRQCRSGGFQETQFSTWTRHLQRGWTTF